MARAIAPLRLAWIQVRGIGGANRIRVIRDLMKMRKVGNHGCKTAISQSSHGHPEPRRVNTKIRGRTVVLMCLIR